VFNESFDVAGFPITILFEGIPLSIIYCTEVPGKFTADFKNSDS